MANRYWVNGGVDNLWSTAGNWSTTSGGGGGSGQPTVSDVAIFDSGSAGYNCEVTASGEVCTDLTMTGYTGTFTMTSGDLKIYGDVTFGSGMTFAGTGGIFWFYETSAGGNITTNGKTITCNVYWGGTLGASHTLQDDLNISGSLLYFRATSDTSQDTLTPNGFKIIFTGADIYTANSLGIVTGSCEIDIRSNVTVWFRHSSDSYYFGHNLHITTAHTLTLKGYNSTAVCRVGSGFQLLVEDTATLAFDGVSMPTGIPYFYCCQTGGTYIIDSGDQVVTYQVNFASVCTNGYWHDTTNSAVNILNYIVSSSQAGIKRLYNYGSILDVVSLYDGQVSNVWEFRGDASIEFRSFNISRNTNIADTYSWQEGITYVFKDLFRIYNAQEGTCNHASLHATTRSKWHIWHNCRVQFTRATTVTRMDCLSVGQNVFLPSNPVITDSLGFKSEEINRSMYYIESNVANPHPYYTTEIFDPVLISGTVELSAVAQQYARVLVITKQTENGKDWFMLRHVLVTDVNGEWSCNVPKNCEVIVEAYYDSGSQKYNSLGKPYITAT